MYDDEFVPGETAPPQNVTRWRYRKWRYARRGKVPGEDMTNPVWDWLIRTRLDAYSAEMEVRGKASFPKAARWCCNRFGQTATLLPDGREIWIGGEHEDHYDPDFFIYNDVIIHEPDGQIKIIGFPADYFPPTDFHSATLLPDGNSILLIGGLSYPDSRKYGTTPLRIYDVAANTFTEIEASGESPGWICCHQATLSDDGKRIHIRRGKISSLEHDYLDNIDDWELDLENRVWNRLTARKWTRICIERRDNESIFLSDLSIHAITSEFSGDLEELVAKEFAKIQNECGVDLMSPKPSAEKIEVYKNLYVPSHPHQPIKEPDDEDDEQKVRIQINGVTVSFLESMEEIVMTVEGELDDSVVDEIANELTEKLAQLEEAECTFRRV